MGRERNTSEGGGAPYNDDRTALRIALRNVLQSASVPAGRALPMTSSQTRSFRQVSRILARVQGIENHELGAAAQGCNDHNRMDGSRELPILKSLPGWARSRSRVSEGLVLTSQGIPMACHGTGFLEESNGFDDVRHTELRIYWDG